MRTAPDFYYHENRDPLPHEEPSNKRRYSLAKVVLAGVEQRRLGGIESEVHSAIQERVGRPPSGNGYYIPWRLRPERRALDSTAGAGSVPTILEPDLIDCLRNSMVCARAGAQFLNDLRGNHAIAKKTSSGVVAWQSESAPVASTQPSIAQQVIFTPHTCGGYIDIPRRALDLMATPDGGRIAEDDLTAAAARELDRVALSGRGAGGEPLGLTQNPSVPVYSIGTNGGAPTRAMVSALERTVAASSAEFGPGVFMTSPLGREKLRNTEKTTGTGRFLWDDDLPGPLGKPGFVSTSIPSNLTKGSGSALTPLLYGCFSQLIIGTWGYPTILVDPFRLSTDGVVRVVLLVDADVQVRHIESFSVCPDMSTT